MSVSLIAVDVDGTLLNSNGEITAETQAAFHDAAAHGIRLVLSTGRARDECAYILRQLPELHYMINCSGASVYDVTQERELYVEGLSMETIRDLYRRLAPVDCLFELMAEGHVFTDRQRLAHLPEYHNHYYIEIIRSTRTPVDMETLLRTRTGPVAKLHLFFRCEADQRRARALLEPAGIPILNSIPENLELNLPTVHKGLGLRRLAEYLHIPPEACMAIGDNFNDVGMLREAGYPVLVANANPEVFPYADYVTASCDENGVAKAIWHVLSNTLDTLRRE